MRRLAKRNVDRVLPGARERFATLFALGEEREAQGIRYALIRRQ